MSFSRRSPNQSPTTPQESQLADLAARVEHVLGIDLALYVGGAARKAEIHEWRCGRMPVPVAERFTQLLGLYDQFIGHHRGYSIPLFRSFLRDVGPQHCSPATILRDHPRRWHELPSLMETFLAGYEQYLANG